MAFDECLDAIRNAAGRDLSDSDLNALADEVERLIRRRRAEAHLDSFAERVTEDAGLLADQWAAAAYQRKRQAAINRVIEAQLMERIGQAPSPSLGLTAVTVGINAPVAGGRLSADARGKALEMQMRGGLIADLEREGLTAAWNSKAYGRQIAQELWEMDRPGGRPGISGSKEARKMAELVHKYQSVAVERQNRAGAWIVARAGYIVRQSHDVAKLRQAGFDMWRAEIEPRLDPSETFEGRDPERFLREAYDGLVTGRHASARGAAESDDSGFRMPPNLANEVSAERVLHFRSANDWYDYNERFGSSDLQESVHYGLRRAAENAALMETFGPNPGVMFNRIRDILADQNRGNPAEFDAIQHKSIQNQFDAVSGNMSIPGNATAARIGIGWRAWQSMAKLGGAVITSITDVANHAAELRYQGLPLLQAYSSPLEAVLRGRGSGERKQITDLINSGIEGLLGQSMARFSAQDNLPGRFSKLQATFFKLNGLSWWTDAHKTAAGMMSARWLAMNADMPLSEVPERLSRLLRQYNIDEAIWDALRAQDMRTADGKAYITPDLAREIPGDVIAGMLDGTPSTRRIEAKRQEIETSLSAYLIDRSDFAVPTPGARERAILFQGLRPGTVEGEAIRFFMQFKAFPVTVLTKPLGREVYGGGASSLTEALFKGKGDIVGLAHYIAATTVMGYLAMATKDLLKGRTPRDPASPATWAASFVQGGGAGIFGDFMFGNYNRYGGGFLETFAGPTASTVADFARIFAKLRDGEDAIPAGQRFVMSNLPFGNLFYLRAGLDYLVLHQLSEMASPGYLRRMERRIEKDNNQTFLLRPSQAIPPGGGDRIFEGVR